MPLTILAAVVGSMIGLSAHHSIASVYDGRQEVTIEGVVSQFHFVNPHPYLLVTVTDSEGANPWRLEMDNRGELAAVGMTALTLRVGDRVNVVGNPSRTEKRSLYLRKLLRAADGFELEQIGSSPRIKRG